MSSNVDSSYTCSLGPEALEKAKTELNEDPSTRLIEVKTLRTRLEKVPGVKSPNVVVFFLAKIGLVARTDTPFLLRFLRARKFNQEKTFQLVLNYYEARAKNPDIFADLKPSRVRDAIDDDFYGVLENRNINGCRVFLARMGNWDADKTPVSTVLKAFYLAISKAAEDEETQVHGVHIVCLLNDFSWKHAAQITPAAAKLAFSMMQDVIPLRLTRLDYVYEPALWDTVFAMFKPFIKEKLRKRIGMNGEKLENLHKTINPDHLPTDLRGKIPLNDKFTKSWKEAFLTSDAQYEEDNKFGFVNMGLSGNDTVSKSGDAGMAGLGGTFKKLEV